MLVLAGHGLWEKGATKELEEELERADVIYVETYTMPSSSWILEAVSKYGNKVLRASRSMLEEGSRKIVEEAREKRVVVLTAGDPLMATSHQALLAEAAERGVDFVYAPGISGVCAAKVFSGLQYYRFGRTATVPGPWKGFKPYSIAAYIYGDLCVDLHTLLLMDISDEGEQLSPPAAARIVLDAEAVLEKELGYRGSLKWLPAVVVERAGMPNARVRAYDSLSSLAATEESFLEPSSVIVPATLNKVEAWIVGALARTKLGGSWTNRLKPREDYCSLYDKIMRWLSS
ncbi:MAG: diphthine synthase [Acidilobaceae archaeon]|nr:diphthine synthase [Acidilobaceae archaeon]MCX8166097.1 diphthine synthase [Acidilobaceae archaeon]MDW7974740.1 diphthine synthase [Sulfolobales archaeon]